MSLDLFYRAETSKDLIDWITKPQCVAIIGDITNAGAAVGIPGQVFVKEFPPGTVVEAAADPSDEPTMDPKAWVHIRLSGEAEQRDFAGPPGPNDFDRWEHSKMVTLVQTGGKSGAHRGVSTFEIERGPNAGVSVFRGSEMEGTIKFHEIYGGNRY